MERVDLFLLCDNRTVKNPNILSNTYVRLEKLGEKNEISKFIDILFAA